MRVLRLLPLDEIQRAEAAELASLTNKQLEELAGLVDQQRTRGRAAAGQRFKTGTDKVGLDTLRSFNRQAAEIKIITSSIVTALGLPDETAAVLKELTPVLREIPPLLKGLPPALKSIESQFVVITEGQNQLRKEIDHLQILISNVSDQISATRP